MQEVFQACENFCQIEERHLCRKSRLWYFLEVFRHNFVQSSKGPSITRMSCPEVSHGQWITYTWTSGELCSNINSQVPPDPHCPTIGDLNLELLVKVVFTSLLYSRDYFFPSLWEKPLRLEIHCFSSNCHLLILSFMDGFWLKPSLPWWL